MMSDVKKIIEVLDGYARDGMVVPVDDVSRDEIAALSSFAEIISREVYAQFHGDFSILLTTQSQLAKLGKKEKELQGEKIKTLLDSMDEGLNHKYSDELDDVVLALFSMVSFK